MYDFINWSASHCSDGLQAEQYQISFTDISEIQILTYVTNTTNSVSYCQIINSSICYFRVRAELGDGSLSSYSACLNINDQLNEKKGIIESVMCENYI